MALQLPATFTPTHDTSGLAGYPAIDDFAPAGTAVTTPGAGTLRDVHFIPWDTTKRVGGWTGYLVTDAGTYFLTHFGSILPAGPVRQGQSIGTVGAVPGNAWQPHIHEGFHSGIDTSVTGASTGGSVAVNPDDKNAYPGWQQAVLSRLGDPATPENVRFLDTWHQYELSAARNNPLNTTWDAPGSADVAINSAGVRSYPSSAVGTDATVATLQGSYYPGIRDALKSGNPFAYQQAHPDVLAEIQKWGSGTFATDLASGKAISGGGPLNDPSVIPGVGTIQDLAGSVSSISDAIGFVLSIRFLEIVGGMALVGIGIVSLAKDQTVGAVMSAASLTPVGREAKAAGAATGARKPAGRVASRREAGRRPQGSGDERADAREQRRAAAERANQGSEVPF